MTARPCIDCGAVTERGPRCPACQHEREAAVDARRGSPSRRGYDARWSRLSTRARRLQPFCSDCGSTDDLTTDHAPEAWRRRARGLAIRLVDVDVVCRRCNSARGAARSPSKPRGGTPLDSVFEPARQAASELLITGDSP
jgi:5-methylcytosine-specific restriction endonuclease McrA